MFQFNVRSIIDDFKYNVTDNNFSEEEVKKFKEWIYREHSKDIAGNFNSLENTKWITRNYLSAKMVLSATVMITSLEYAIDKNVKMSVPYLSYYAILTSCRAFLYTIPHNKWENDEIGNEKFLKMSHSKIINLVEDYLNHLDKDYANEVKTKITSLRQWRELFSYKFPSSGISVMEHYSFYEIVDICATLCELAQMASEQLYKYVSNKCKDNYEEWSKVELDLMHPGFTYDDMIDLEDVRRLDYLVRKQPFPTSIYYTMTEGMVEDYFGTWCEDSEGNEEGKYNPDENWRIIFPVP